MEYSTVEAAMSAKQALNNFMIFNDGSRMTIHNANLETVKFQNNNPGGIGKFLPLTILTLVSNPSILDYTVPGNKPLPDVQDENNRANFNLANIPQNHSHSQNYQMPNRIESFQHPHHNGPDFSHDSLHSNFRLPLINILMKNFRTTATTWRPCIT